MGFLKCCGYLFVSGFTSFVIGTLLPSRWFRADQKLYVCRAFERGGSIYNKLRIHAWKHRIPDMSRILPAFLPSKSLLSNSRENLPRMIQETCKAEFVHWVLCFTGFYCVHLWPGLGGIVISVMSFVGNLMYIIIQRYNRPRFCQIWSRYTERRQMRSTV